MTQEEKMDLADEHKEAIAKLRRLRPGRGEMTDIRALAERAIAEHTPFHDEGQPFINTRNNGLLCGCGRCGLARAYCDDA